MALTPEDIDKLTIGEVRAIAARAAEALVKFREAQLALGAPIQSPLTVAQPPPVELPPVQAAALAQWHADPERQRLLDLARNKAEEPGDEFTRPQ